MDEAARDKWIHGRDAVASNLAKLSGFLYA